MAHIQTRKGYDLKLLGRPSEDVTKAPSPKRVAALPASIPNIKPRLNIAEGDTVQIGSVLFEDKQQPWLKFLSPGAGKVSAVNLGARRKVMEIVIQLEASETVVPFEAVDEAALEKMAPPELIDCLANGGVWPFLRTLPFRTIAPREPLPPAIFVALDNGDPFHPTTPVYLNGKQELLAFGIRVLKKLTPQVFVYGRPTVQESTAGLDNLLTHTVSGPYPADDPGVFLYAVRKDASLNRAWYIQGQDLILLAEMLREGRYPVDRTVAVSNQRLPGGDHRLTRLGAPIGDLLPAGGIGNSERIMAGGVMRGRETTADGYLGFYETAVAVLPVQQEGEFLGFARPGLKKPSRSRTFLSSLVRGPLPMDCNMHGEERACVNCGTCADLCPVDILPQFTYKTLVAGEIEEALEHGLLDCVRCGLCTYGCPSKIELSTAFEKAQSDYYREQTAS